MEVIDRWYAQVSIDDLKAHFRKIQLGSMLSKEQKEARSQTPRLSFPSTLLC